jgi:hypothetical protein
MTPNNLCYVRLVVGMSAIMLKAWLYHYFATSTYVSSFRPIPVSST